MEVIVEFFTDETCFGLIPFRQLWKEKLWLADCEVWCNNIGCSKE